MGEQTKDQIVTSFKASWQYTTVQVVALSLYGWLAIYFLLLFSHAFEQSMTSLLAWIIGYGLAIWILEQILLKKKWESVSNGSKEEYLQPWFVAHTAGYAPILTLVFAIHGFIGEATSIPSTSMEPTIKQGDYLITNKLAYNAIIPILGKNIATINGAKNGEIATFSNPKSPKTVLIKRVIGVGGDRVSYDGRHISVNGTQKTSSKPKRLTVNGKLMDEFEETNGSASYSVLVDANQKPPKKNSTFEFPMSWLCTHNESAFTCDVPHGYVFVMGDNRDNSEDSRVIGFINVKELRGMAGQPIFNIKRN